jgi:hypothetical protein
MTDNFATLGISEDATPEEIQDAFNKKRAMLIASIEDDQQRAAALMELQDAFDAISKSKTLALMNEEPPKKKIDPLLDMVGNVNTPIRNESDGFVTVACPHCGFRNHKDAAMCSNCGQQISRHCPKCGKVLPIDAQVCSRCNTVIRDLNQSRIIETTHMKDVIDSERQGNQIRVNALEEHHQTRAVYGVVFWLVLIGALAGLCVIIFVVLPLLGLSIF